MARQLLQHSLSLILLLSVLAVSLPATAQTRRAAATITASNQPPKQSGAACTGAWSGIVKYQRDYEDSFNEEKSDKNYSNHFSIVNRTQRRQVSGKIILDGKSEAQPGGFAMNVGGVMMGASTQTGRTSVSIVESENEFTKAGYTDSCGWETRLKRCETTMKRNGQTNAEGSSEQFFLQFQGDSYDFSFRLPRASGTIETVKKSSCTGHCNGDTNDNQTFNDPVNYDAEPVSVKNQKLDPKNPDRLSDTVSIPSRDGKT
ncbi:MAG TPA: hypothetical protein VK308_17085, partial [Pyrinomonadaceae bacterium]|nr:hypothetical protein [Pyrinomonadaceae bacterium]